MVYIECSKFFKQHKLWIDNNDEPMLCKKFLELLLQLYPCRFMCGNYEGKTTYPNYCLRLQEQKRNCKMVLTTQKSKGKVCSVHLVLDLI